MLSIEDGEVYLLKFEFVKLSKELQALFAKPSHGFSNGRHFSVQLRCGVAFRIKRDEIQGGPEFLVPIDVPDEAGNEPDLGKARW